MAGALLARSIFDEEVLGTAVRIGRTRASPCVLRGVCILAESTRGDLAEGGVGRSATNTRWSPHSSASHCLHQIDRIVRLELALEGRLDAVSLLVLRVEARSEGLLGSRKLNRRSLTGYSFLGCDCGGDFVGALDLLRGG